MKKIFLTVTTILLITPLYGSAIYDRYDINIAIYYSTIPDYAEEIKTVITNTDKTVYFCITSPFAHHENNHKYLISYYT